MDCVLRKPSESAEGKVEISAIGKLLQPIDNQSRKRDSAILKTMITFKRDGGDLATGAGHCFRKLPVILTPPARRADNQQRLVGKERVQIFV